MINIVTALACEANPIIQHFHLRKSPQVFGFPVYSNEIFTLIISGMGKFAAASAVGYLQAMSSQAEENLSGSAAPHCWLNVGIAGHKTMDIGTALLAHSITDGATLQRFYPCFTFDLPCTTADVISVEQAETSYSTDAAYDMEALGFCAAASRFSSFEMIHCLKIISDNQAASCELITKHVGEELIGSQLLIMENLLHKLEKLQQTAASMYVLPQDYRFLINRFRFSVTQKTQLKRLLQRWRVLENARVSDQIPIEEFENAKQVLLGIDAHLKSKVFIC